MPEMYGKEKERRVLSCHPGPLPLPLATEGEQTWQQPGVGLQKRQTRSLAPPTSAVAGGGQRGLARPVLMSWAQLVAEGRMVTFSP